MKRLLYSFLIAHLICSLAFAGFPVAGGGGGTPDDDSVTSAKVLDNTIVDADVNSSAAIDMTKIGGGAVTNAELLHLDNVTSSIQTQLDAKAPLVSPSFTTPTLGVAGATTLNTGQGAYELYAMDQNVRTTDNVTFGTVTASEFISNAADNTRGVTVPNTADPTTTNLAAGKGWLNSTSNMLKWRNGDNTATLEVFTSGASHTLNFATTGTLGGAITILDNVAGPTAAQCYGSLNIVNAAITVTLPAAASGMSICVLSTAAAAVNVDVDASDVIYLNGVALSAGDKITSASAAGDFICLVSSGTVNWYTLGRSGTWTDTN